MPLIRTVDRARFLDAGPFPQALRIGDRQALMLLCLQNAQELVAPADDRAETTFVVVSGDGFVVEGQERHAVEAGDVVHVAAGIQKALVASAGTFTVLGVRSLSSGPD